MVNKNIDSLILGYLYFCLFFIKIHTHVDTIISKNNLGDNAMNEEIYTQLARDGSSVFIVKVDNEKKVALNSLYSPDKEVKHFLKEFEGIEKKFVIIIGVGNGTVVKKLIDTHSFNNNVHFLIIEPFNNVKLEPEVADIIRKSIGRLSFYYQKDINSLVFSKYLSLFTSIEVSIHIHPNYLKAGKEYIQSLISTLREGIKVKEILNNTERKFALDWIFEPLLNTNVIEKAVNISHLKDKYAGETAVLVSAGPSLHMNIPFLKKMANTSHIFAVGPAIRPLLKHDIHPDFGLSIDSSETNYNTHFKDLDFNGTLIFETMSNHNIQREHSGKLVSSKALSDEVTSFLYEDHFGLPHSAPSVAIFTLLVVKFLGFKSVYLVGQDLALINGEYYSKGVQKHSGMADVKPEVVVEDNAGGEVGTTRALKLFLDAFNTLISSFEENSIEIFNVSKYGAKISGTMFVEPDHVEIKTPKKPIQIPDLFNLPNKSVQEFIEEIVAEFKQLKKEVSLASTDIKFIITSQKLSKSGTKKVLAKFNEIAGNRVMEKVILSNLTFMFNNIINKFVYFEEKSEYTDEDLFVLLKELSKLYGVVEMYLEEILNDPRINELF
jgi:hypothetical protein